MNSFIYLVAATTQLDSTIEVAMKRKITIGKRAELSAHRAKCIKSEVIFGSPKNRCKGAGICKVLTLSAGREAARPIAYITLETNQRVRFDIVKESVTQEMIDQHFLDNRFQVTDRFLFPRPILRNWEIERLVIQPGFYEVLETQQFYTICFD